jgi:hypothetical protein
MYKFINIKNSIMEKQVLKRFTMNVDHTNPDAKVVFTTIGTGKTEKEAAVFALGMFYKIMDGEEGDQGIQRYEDALEIVRDHFWDKERVDQVIDSLIKGEIEKNSDIFYNSYESTNVEYSWSEVEEVSECGYTASMEVTETHY